MKPWRQAFAKTAIRPISTLCLTLLLVICGKAQNPALVLAPARAIGPNVLSCSLQDQAGRLWFGTTEQGIFRYDGKVFTHFTEKDGLGSPHIFSMLEDQAGIIWIGSFEGLFRYDEKGFTKVPIPHGYQRPAPEAGGTIAYDPDCILSIFQDRSGLLWFGSMGFGAYCYNGKTFRFFREEPVLSHAIVQCLMQDRAGRLWLGTRGDGILSYDGSAFRQFTSATVSNNHLLDILEDNSGDLWFGTVGGGVRRYHQKLPSAQLTQYDGELFSMLSKDDKPCFHNVSAMLQDRSGRLWFGGDGGGLCVYQDSSWVSYTTKNGLVSNRVTCLLEDADGYLWLGCRGGGLCRFDGTVFVDFSAYLK